MTRARRAGRLRWRPAATVLGVAVVLAVSADPARSQSDEDDPAGLQLVAQTYAVAEGGIATFEFVVTGDVPEIAPTTTTTTTTSTTTTTTTTTAPPAPPVTGQPPGAAPPTPPTPGTTTTAAPATTTTTTVPPGPAMTVQVRSHRALATRSDVTAALAGVPGPVIDILEFDLDEVAVFDDATRERRLSLAVPVAAGAADVTQLDLLEPGVHPVTVQLRRERLPIASYTTLVDVVRADGPGRGPFTMALLASVDDPGPAPTTEELSAAADQLSAIAELAAAVEVPITAAVPPGLTTSLLGEDDRLRAAVAAALDADDRLLVLPDQPLDPSAAGEAGLGDEFARRMADGEAILSAAFPDTPSARGGWIVDGPITAVGATTIRNVGIPMLVVPYDRYVEYGNSLDAFTDPSLMYATTLTDGSSLRVVVVDPVTELLAADADTERSPLERAIRLMADTSALRYQFDPDRRSLLLAAPDFRAPDVDVVRELARLTAQHPDYAFDTVGRLPDVTNSLFLDGALVDLELDAVPATSLGDRLDSIAVVRLRAADVASMLPEEDDRPGEWDAQLRTALSTALTASEAAPLIEAVEAEVAELRAQVVEPEPFDLTIGGSQAEIPFRVENVGGTPLRISVHAEAEKLSFPAGDVEVVLEPNQITVVPIPVEARANGVFPVFVELRTPAGNALTDPIELTARVSTLTGLGRVFTVGALLVLATWWFSYFRRRRTRQFQAGVAGAVDRHPASSA